MALINRLTRLFSSDFHAVLDRIEEPATLLKQSVREMEEILGRDRIRSARLTEEHSELLAREKELASTLRDLEAEIAACFELERDDLARAQVKRKLEMRRHQSLLIRRREALDAMLLRHRACVEENASRLQGMRQKAELLANEQQDKPAGTGGISADFPTDFTVSDDEVELAFLREKQRRGQQ